MSLQFFYRKEALNHRLEAQQYGQVVLSQPRVISHGLIALLMSLIFVLVVFFIVPVNTSFELKVFMAQSNFMPIVFPDDAIVERHYMSNGSSIMPGSSVTRVQFYRAGEHTSVNQTLVSDIQGVYFAVAKQGEQVKAYEPLARILRLRVSNEFEFVLTDSASEQLSRGQEVFLMSNDNRVTGVVRHIDTAEGERPARVTIKLRTPYDVSLLAPGVQLQLMVKNHRRNLLSYLRDV